MKILKIARVSGPRGAYTPEESIFELAYFVGKEIEIVASIILHIDVPANADLP